VNFYDYYLLVVVVESQPAIKENDILNIIIVTPIHLQIMEAKAFEIVFCRRSLYGR
jgi:hypothetical protein